MQKKLLPCTLENNNKNFNELRVYNLYEAKKLQKKSGKSPDRQRLKKILNVRIIFLK